MFYFDTLLNNQNEKKVSTEISTKDEIDKAVILNTERKVVGLDEVIQIPDLQQKPIEQIFDSHPTKQLVNKIVDSIYERDENQIQYVKNMAEVRKIDPEILLKNHCFFSANVFYMESMFADLGVYKKEFHITTAENTLWKDRFIIPIRDFKGEVFGFVGYNKFSEAKYVEYSSPMYKAITIKALGLNNIQEILDQKYCIFTEGSFDYFRARQHEFPVIANLGISFNKLLKPLIDRLDVVFTALDNDETGLKNMDAIDKLHPYVYHIQFKDTKDKEGKPVKGDMDEALKDLNRVKQMKKEIDKRLQFKNIRQTKRILI